MLLLNSDKFADKFELASGFPILELLHFCLVEGLDCNYMCF
jgi:hypothetical protein